MIETQEDTRLPLEEIARDQEQWKDVMEKRVTGNSQRIDTWHEYVVSNTIRYFPIHSKPSISPPLFYNLTLESTNYFTSGWWSFSGSFEVGADWGLAFLLWNSNSDKTHARTKQTTIRSSSARNKKKSSCKRHSHFLTIFALKQIPFKNKISHNQQQFSK